MKRPRFRVDVGEEELRVVLPARRHPLLVLVFVLWAVMLVNWFVSLRSGGRAERDQFMLGWGVLCALPGVVALLWLILGRERLTIREGVLGRRVEVGALGITRAYDLAKISHLRLAELPPGVWQVVRAGPFPIGPAGGSIAFDYGGRMERLGAGLAEDEVPALIEVLAPFVRGR